MSINDLTGNKVKDTYGKIVQVVGGKLFDGLGNALDPNSIGLTFNFTQNTPSLLWTVVHNLNRLPNVIITDSAGSVLFADIQYVDNNTLTINFSQLTSGNAWCS